MIYSLGDYDVVPQIIIHPGSNEIDGLESEEAQLEALKKHCALHIGPVYVIHNRHSFSMGAGVYDYIDNIINRTKRIGFPAVRVWADASFDRSSYSVQIDKDLGIYPVFDSLREAVRTIKCHGRYRRMNLLTFSSDKVGDNF